MRNHGLTLLEVILAILVLFIVITAFTSLQIVSLRSSFQGRATQAIVRDAQNFLEALRANPSSIPTTCNQALTLGRVEASCQYTPCSLNHTSLICAGTVNNPSAYRVTLRIPRENPRLTLETVVYLP